MNNKISKPFPWEKLLQLIEGGHVVPIVGQDLLRLQNHGSETLLYPLLASRLATHLQLPSEPPQHDSLNDVACHYLAAGGDLEDIYSAIKSIMPGPSELAIPEPLLKLAAIRPLKLFVSTTFDQFLEAALNQVRFGDRPKTLTLAYAPNSVRDLPSELDQLDRPVVYHLFGKVSAIPDYAVTEEDMLEFMHGLQSDTRHPKMLFDELAKRHLLILGSNFPDWLARFFIRTGSRERLYYVRGKTDIIADTRMCADRGLVSFLESFSSRTKFYKGGAVEFVDELAERWQSRQGPIAASATEEPSGPVGEIAPGAIFLSYASEDLPAALSIRDSLEGAGMDVWLDKKDLRAGDLYEAKIRSYIEKSSLFIPILSSHCLTPERRFFRLEWEHAERVAAMAPPSARFIIPIVIDGISYTEEALPASFRKLHWEHLPLGHMSPGFLETMKVLYRSYQRSAARTP